MEHLPKKVSYCNLTFTLNFTRLVQIQSGK